MAKDEGKAFSSIRIIGSGLIGTSIGLALAARGVGVEMVDRDSKAQKLAQDLIASKVSGDPEVVLFAIPASALAESFESQFKLNPGSKFIDIASVKTKPQVEVSRINGGASRFLATHPMAGREIGGAASARADLFEGRSWIYCPTFGDGTKVDSDVLEAGLWLIDSLGATPIAMSAAHHDSAVALVSHLPQIVASLLAGQLKGAKSEDLDLAGGGLRDTTRIAASDPELWKEIIASNAQEILPLLINLQNDLGSLINSLDDPAKVGSVIAAGNEGRSKIPGKHGGKGNNFQVVTVVIEDAPGALASLLTFIGEIGVNLEDLNLEHSPGAPIGLVELQVLPEVAERLSEQLTTNGWRLV